MTDAEKEVATLAEAVLVPGSRLRRSQGRGFGRVRLHGRQDGEPTYEEVCSGETGHAEVTNSPSTPKQVSFKEILRCFFVIHDPTTSIARAMMLARSIVRRSSTYSPSRNHRAAMLANLGAAKIYEDPIVTEVGPA